MVTGSFTMLIGCKTLSLSVLLVASMAIVFIRIRYNSP